MRKSWTVWVVGWMMLAGALMAQDPPAEFRGIWVTRFDWTSEEPTECKANIVHVFEALAAANFNAAVFQIRGEAETLYPSKLEPWSVLLNEKDPGFDPLALAIEEAHKRGIAFHAYINAMPLRSLSSRRPPADKNHLFHKHGPGSADSWVSVDRAGKPAREDYLYLSPGIPDVHAYLRQVIMDVVRRYDIDGIHLDRIRYPGRSYSFDAVSNQRFAGRGNPNLKERADWQREQLDKFINDLAAEIRAEKPKVLFSCSAWGIYNRHHLPGYQDFSSGYHDYAQDTWNWVRIGAMDILMPMIYWDIADPKPNYDELLKDFARGVGPEHLVGGQEIKRMDETINQIRVTREVGALGTVLFAFRGAERRGVLARCKEQLYSSPVAVPPIARVTQPKTGGILGTVTAGDGRPLVDAWVSLLADGSRSGGKGIFSRTWTTSSDGRFAFLEVPPGKVKVRVAYAGVPSVEAGPIEIKVGQMARIDVAVPQAEAARDKPFLQILAPADGFETGEEVVHVLGRTSLDCKVSVQGVSSQVYSTGSFARDNIPLTAGKNVIEITATDGKGASTTVTLAVVRKQVQTRPATSQTQAAEPFEDLGSRTAECVENNAGITFGLHTVRLGGPYLSRIPIGTRFEVVGKQGSKYKVRLSKSLTGFIPTGEARLVSKGTPVPHNYFTSCEVWGDAQCDRVSVSLGDKVVIAVNSETEPNNRLFIDFFNTHHALTWISHKSTAKLIGAVTAEQIEENWLRLTVPLKCRQIWGYWTEMDGDVWTLFVRRPPIIASPPDSPLKGLFVALEAGHGGSGDGAVGFLGTKEKTINLNAVESLKTRLEERGAKTILLRPGDSEPMLSARVEVANENKADFCICLHCNAAGTSRGFLRVSGASTYYKDKHCYVPARLVYERLLRLGWNEFGVVGNFSYYPLGNTRTPTILIEQAFMSNPADEARLLDPEYQKVQAQAIVEAMEEFVSGAREPGPL